MKYKQIEMIFHKGFWTDLITPKIRAKSSKLPIFIVGMMRCWSAHSSILCEILMVGFEILLGQRNHASQIWGMGEDSVFNGNISSFRDRLVATGNQGAPPYTLYVVLCFVVVFCI